MLGKVNGMNSALNGSDATPARPRGYGPALDQALAQARRRDATAARRNVLGMLRDGDIDAQWVVALAVADPDVGRTRLTQVMAVLGWRRAEAEAALAKMGIASSRRVGWLITARGNRHLEEFLRVAEHRGRPKLPPEWIYQGAEEARGL